MGTWVANHSIQVIVDNELRNKEHALGNGIRSRGAVSIVSPTNTGAFAPMKLTYRGIAFNSSVAGSPSLETGETGNFLGNSYPIKQPQMTQRQPAVELTYRGVRYHR